MKIKNAWRSNDENCNIIVQSGDQYCDRDFYYLKGLDMFKLNVTGSGYESFTFQDSRFPGATFYYNPSGNDPRKQHLKPWLQVNKDVKFPYVEMDNEEIDALEENTEIKAHPLPRDAIECRFLYKTKDDKRDIIYVDRPIYDWQRYRIAYALYKGQPGKMEKIQVTDIKVYRDGGSIELAMGYIHILSCPIRGTATWDDNIQLEELDKSKFDYASLGIPGIPSPKLVLRTPCETISIEDQLSATVI
jgi:hypothetical protein